jgi:hypothetical protein
VVGCVFLVGLFLPLVNETVAGLYASKFDMIKIVTAIFAAIYVIIPVIDFARYCPNYIKVTNKYSKPQKRQTTYDVTQMLEINQPQDSLTMEETK